MAAILNNFTNFKKEQSQGNDQKLGRIGSTLIKGAEVLGKNMEKGAEKASNLIKYASEKQKNKIQPVEHDVKVSPMLKTSMKGKVLQMGIVSRTKMHTKVILLVQGFPG